MHTKPSAPPRASTSPETPARRRRATAALLTTVAATALVGTVSAAPADAFTRSVGTVWNRVAQCESSQHWHINSGNGFYGGLQFSYSTWVNYHGRKYAWRADKASRAEQIEVARRVLAYQGPGAWPYCSKVAGLTRSSGGATKAPLPKNAG